MQYRRSVQREDRRRRVLRDELGSADHHRARNLADDAARDGKTYTDDAMADCETRVFDVIPRRPWSLLVLLFSGLTVIVALAVAHAYRFDWLWLDRSDLTLFDVAQPTSLATWVSSMMLAMSSIACVMIFIIRRHRLDDYGGRYRLWIWTSFACLVASIDITAGIHRLVQSILIRLTATTLYGDGSIWWVSLVAAIVAVLGFRAFMDMRSCLVAKVFLIHAGACYAIAITLHLQLWSMPAVMLTTVTRVGTTMLGHFFLFYSQILYARMVFLEARDIGESDGAKKDSVKSPNVPRHRGFFGRIFSIGDQKANGVQSSQTNQPRAESSTRSDKDSARAHREHNKANDSVISLPGTEQPVNNDQNVKQSRKAKSGHAQRPPWQSSDKTELTTDDDTGREISKSERRRLRKQLRRQRRAA